MAVDYLALAAQTARGIVEEALWKDEQCTWNVVDVGRNGRDQGTATPTTIAGPSLYQGAAGIALFLAELWAKTGEDNLLATINGAAHYVRNERMAINSLGFYSGRSGVAYVLARLSHLLKNDEYGEWARDIVRVMPGHVGDDIGIDVIAGSAGAIAPLLQSATWVELPGVRELAQRMGDHLLAKAHRGPHGWWWGHMTEWNVAGLTGFAHGASGCGYGLLELFQLAGDVRYRFAAEQAIAYETALFDSARRNWPDLRHVGLMTSLRDADDRAALRSRLRRGESMRPYGGKFMNAWCHGAPGIALARLRSYQLLGDERSRNDARRAVETTAEGMPDASNASLCHGAFGNCETLIFAETVLGDCNYRELIDATIERQLAARHTPSQWLSGCLGSPPDPSLMMGNAGVGYFLLRLAEPTVPSILLVTAPKNDNTVVLEQAAAGDCEAYSNAFFGRTRRLLTKSLGSRFDSSVGFNDVVQRSYAAIREAIEGETHKERRVRLLDALRPEEARYQASLRLTDLSADTIERLTCLDVNEIDWDNDTFEISRRTQLVDCEYDWDAWLAGTDDDPLKAPVVARTYLIYLRQHDVSIRPIGTFAAAVVRSLNSRCTLDEILERVSDDLSTDSTDDKTERLRALTIAQLRQLISTGILVAVRAGDSARRGMINTGESARVAT